MPTFNHLHEIRDSESDNLEVLPVKKREVYNTLTIKYLYWYLLKRGSPVMQQSIVFYCAKLKDCIDSIKKFAVTIRYLICTVYLPTKLSMIKGSILEWCVDALFETPPYLYYTNIYTIC